MISIFGGETTIGAVQSDGYLTVVHGGEAPGEPKSPEAIIKGQALLQALGSIATENQFPINNSQLSGIVPTYAERASMLAAQALEANPIFNAGRGGKLQHDGVVRVSAGFMESTRQRLSSVVNVEGILHPSHLAYVLQGRRHSMLDDQGALALAHELNINQENLVVPHTYQAWLYQQATKESGKRGTIGSVTIDAESNLAVITSTGGVGNEVVGRIGDTPTVAGTYCTDCIAISCTGFGEQIVNQAFAARIGVRVIDGMQLIDAMQRSIAEADARGYILDAIAVSLHGKDVSWAVGGTEPDFAWAAHTPDGEHCFTN